MAYVPPKYPAAIPTAEDLPDRTDDVDWMYAARYNELKKELRAALTELGALPKGAHADVKTRLDTLGVGDVVGPGSALNEAIVRYNGTSGKLIQATLGAKIDDTGRLTNTAQPCFSAVNGTEQSNIAKDTDVTVILGVEIFDVGNNFAANTFTAPITGKYQLNASLNLKTVDNTAASYILKIVTSNRTYWAILFTSSTADDGITLSVKADMDINDTAIMVVRQTGGVGGTVDLHNTLQFFSGGLLF